MTTYDVNKNPKPTTVELGVEIATRAQEEYQQFDGSSYYVPMHTKIIFLHIPYEKAFLKCGGTDYKYVAEQLAQQGFSTAMWTVKSCWLAVSDDVADSIF